MAAALTASNGHRRIGVISGHSHQPRKAEQDGVLFFNPGSAGPRRFRLPISLGRIDVTGGGIRASLIDLEQDRPR